MNTIYVIWSFFLTTHHWFWGLWTGWFGFFKGIIPWYLNLNVGWQIVIGIFYLSIGLLIIKKNGGWLKYDEKSSKPKFIKIVQDIGYNLFIGLILPAAIVVSVMISLPLLPAIFFYGLWIIVWFFVIILAFMYACFIWPFTKIF